MREKTAKAVITFSATSDALALEAAARQHVLPGRIIPVPSDIDAGCGLAWCAPLEERANLLEVMGNYGLAYEGAYEVLMY